MKLLKKVSGVALALPLMVACSTYDLGAINDQMIDDWPFAQALHEQYMRLAYDESAEDDWGDALFFAGKAQVAADAANEGLTVPDPQMVNERKIPEDSVDLLNSTYDGLMVALDNGRRTKPVAAAQAQTSFDCWLQELEENIQPEDIALCRDDFDVAMELLARKDSMAMEAGPFMVYFGFDSAELDDAARALIKALASHGLAMNADAEITIIGHTDTAGDSEYNDDLSLSRVAAVGKALSDAGIVASIYMSSVGEEMLMMQTGDGVREAKNRRVEIILSQ